MVEHASLRLHFQFAKKTANWDAIYDVEEFVRKCHAKVEDEVVFPRLRNMVNQDEVLMAISRLEADHRLIDKIGEQVKKREDCYGRRSGYVEKENPTLCHNRGVPQRKRRVAYFSTLEV